MSWVLLIIAIILEVAGTVCMKLAEGFNKPIPSILLFVFYFFSFYFVTISLRKIDIGTTYAVWSGLGTALITIIGVYSFKEPVTLIKSASIGLIILGVLGLNLDSNGH